MSSHSKVTYSDRRRSSPLCPAWAYFIFAVCVAALACNPASAAGVQASGDSTSRAVFEGKVRIDSVLRAPGTAERTNSADYYLVVVTDSIAEPNGDLQLLHEVLLLPPEAEFWSRRKQLSASFTSRRKVDQHFPETGEFVGFAAEGENELTPLLPAYHIGSLPRMVAEMGKPLERTVQIHSPVHAQRPEARLVIEMAEKTADCATFTAEMEAPEQSWEQEGQRVTFSAHRSETIIVECTRGTLNWREGHQKTLIRADNGYERRETVKYSLREANPE